MFFGVELTHLSGLNRIDHGEMMFRREDGTMPFAEIGLHMASADPMTFAAYSSIDFSIITWGMPTSVNSAPVRE